MNVFQYSQLAEANWKANLENMTGWKPQYTFYSDFGIAEFWQVYCRDSKAIKDTYNNFIKNWSADYEALTEIILVLNHKIWAFYGDKVAGVDARYLGVTKEIGNEIARLYDELWRKAQDVFFAKYEDNKKAMAYYYEVTD